MCRLRGVKITLLPHVRLRMEQRNISEEEVRGILESPDLEYPGKLGRTVAERSPAEEGCSVAVRVIYNLGLEDERIVVTVEFGRPSRNRPQEGEEL